MPSVAFPCQSIVGGDLIYPICACHSEPDLLVGITHDTVPCVSMSDVLIPHLDGISDMAMGTPQLGVTDTITR